METTILTVDYNNMTLEQMVAVGNYDWEDEKITGNRFLLSGTGKVTLEPKLFHFDHDSFFDLDEAIKIKEMEQDGFRPGKIEELLAYGAALPEEQRNYAIVALGPVPRLDGNRDAAYLEGNDSIRSLHLGQFGGGWDPSSRFLGVREVVSKS